MNRFAPLALAAAAVTVIVVAGIGQLLRTPNVGPSSTSVPPSAASAGPSAPAASAAASERVFGWPDRGENGAGLYSWDGAACEGRGYCGMNWMHNGYGSGDVEITVGFAGDKGPGTAVTVAGHEAMYRRLSAHWEKWTIDIEGTFITIELVAEPGTSEADLAEAHAIIDSMRTEPRDNDLGFRLVFRLTTDDWDSG